MVNFVCYSQSNKQKLITDFNINLGVTMFKDPFYDKGFNRDFPVICKAGLLGLEFYNQKIKTSIEVKKAYWLSLNAGNYQSPVSGIGIYDYIGITKYLPLTKKTNLYFNIGYSFIRENGYKYVPTRQRNNINAPLGPSNPKYGYLSAFIASLTLYTAEAATFAVGTNFTKHFFTELRCNYYTAVHHPFFNKGTNIYRFQLSIYYKINPHKTQKPQTN